jgi:hypothetical protein
MKLSPSSPEECTEKVQEVMVLILDPDQICGLFTDQDDIISRLYNIYSNLAGSDKRGVTLEHFSGHRRQIGTERTSFQSRRMNPVHRLEA